ncbi:MAG: FAD-dependent oxidoreductase [Pseudomonadota bacterium]
MSEILKPDLCVIGAGSGGLSVAAIAAAFGVPVVLIEKGKMGGDCLNYGCVPSKALLAAGKHAEAIRSAPKFGVLAGEPDVNFRRVHDHVHQVIAEIEPNDSVERFTALGVHVIQGHARFADKKTVVVDGQKIQARRTVIATGSSAATPPIPGLDETPYLTNETLFENTRKPNHLIIIGAGPIGLEMAQAHRRLGAEVTVVDAAKAMAKDDPELTAVVLDHLRKEGIRILENTPIRSVAPRGKTGVKVSIGEGEAAEDLSGSHLLVAAGRKPNIDGLDLEKAGIQSTARGIHVDQGLRTTNRKVYAIGDVAGGLQFTHVANYHAGLVIQNALFRVKAKVNNDLVPWVTYTDPELAHVGLTEATARERNIDFRVLRWPLAENDRAQAERKTSGFVKAITDKKGRILGASIVGTQAGELIQTWALAVSQKLTVAALRNTIAPYPTLHEVSKRAAVTFYGDVPRKPFVRRLLAFLRRFG